MKFCFSLLLIITCFTSFSQSDYFVSTSGNDSNSGSISSPWLTIQYGISQLVPGDVLNIRGGVYEEKLDVNVSGTASQYITIQNYQNDEVILDAINSNTDIAIVYTENAYLIIKGLHLTNNQQNYSMGLFVSNAGHHIEIINNKISNIDFSTNSNANVNTNTNSVPMAFLGNNASDSIHDITIRGNEVFSNMTGFSENITLGGNVSGFIIENNIVHDNTNIGIDMTGNYGECPNPLYDNARNGVVRNNTIYNCLSTYSASAGIYVDGGKNIVVENNTSHHNGYGGEIGCEENGDSDNIIFRNNLFYLNASAGMHIGGYDENTTGRVTNSKVLNNTFYKNDTDNSYNGELIISQFEDGEIMNNIFYISNQNVYLYSYRSQPNLVMDYNLVFTSGNELEIETTVNGNQGYSGLLEFYTATSYGGQSIYGDPLFIAPNDAIPDFHISQNSPSINQGNPLYIVGVSEVDLDGGNRVSDTIIDCGVDEFSNGNSITLNLKAFLEGAYENNSQLMTDNLREGQYIPLLEPYTSLGFNHVIGGGEIITNEVLSQTGANAIVDWIFIEIRNGENFSEIVATQSVLIQRDGDIVSLDGISQVLFEGIVDVNSVIIIIRHRNHFGVRSEQNYDVTNEIVIDFTNPNTLVFGTNSMNINNGAMVLVSGDANNDGQVNAVDKNSHWRPQNGQAFNYQNSVADFNMDGIVNAVDKNLYWRINNSKIEQLD